MLSNIHVKNFALIDEADIELSDNLNILTGETGAGKSILLGAVNLALGARTSKDVVKSDAEYALSELTFTGVSDRLKEKAESLGISLEDELVISRKLYSNGKNVIRINGETFNASAVKQLTASLIDIYGQNENQTLNDRDKQLELVDHWVGDKAYQLKRTVQEEYSAYRTAKKELNELEIDPSSMSREIDRLQFEIKEIEEAAISEGEEEELKLEHSKLANSRLIVEGVSGAASLLYDDDSVSDKLSAAIKCLVRVSEFDPELSQMYDSLVEADTRISEIYRELSDYLEDIPDDEEELLRVEERLDLISHLKQKYGNSVSMINAYLQNDRDRLEKLLNFENTRAAIMRRVESSEKSLVKLYDELSALRKAGAKELLEKVVSAMKDLNFNHVCFEISFNKKEGFFDNGTDEISFLISLNPGEALKPLERIASGGELSRIMLAIKSVMAVKDDIDTLIFDEIDTGISGRTAQMVAEKLALISGAHQVICITHLVQIASMADTHFYIEKSVEGQKTKVDISVISGERITDELSRMLSGAQITEGIRESAAEIVKMAIERKKSIRRL